MDVTTSDVRAPELKMPIVMRCEVCWLAADGRICNNKDADHEITAVISLLFENKITDTTT